MSVELEPQFLAMSRYHVYIHETLDYIDNPI